MTRVSLSASRLRSVLQRVSAGIALLEDDALVWANPTFLRLAEAATLSPGELAKQASMANLIEIGGVPYAARVDGSATPELIEISPAAYRVGAAIGSNERDALTGVLNRGALEERLNAWFLARRERPFALGFLDLNGFKSVNDRHGHLVGDACLREAGRRLRLAVRDEDLVGRFGGDEFVLLLSGVTDAQAFRPVAERIAKSFEAPIATDAGPMTVGSSLGAAYALEDYATGRQLLAAADRAMYAEKGLSQPATGPADVADSALLG